MLVRHCVYVFFVFFFKQKTAYEMRISDWSSDVCSSDLAPRRLAAAGRGAEGLCRQRRIGRARRRAAAARRHALNLHHLFCVHRRCGYTARLTHPTSPRAALRMFRSEEHTSELQSPMRISYYYFFLKHTINQKSPTYLKC